MTCEKCISEKYGFCQNCCETVRTIKEFNASGLSVGDIVITSAKNRREVLAVSGNVFACSCTTRFDRFSEWYTFQEAIDNGWKIEGAEKSEIDEMIERISLVKSTPLVDGKAIDDCIELLKKLKKDYEI